MKRNLVIAACVIMTATGCSQVDALAPVSGQNIAGLRYAANDILLQQMIPVLIAPTCTGSGATIACEGRTTDDQPITVNSTANDASTMDVKVGSRVLYSGSVQAVLDDASTAQ